MLPRSFILSSRNKLLAGLTRWRSKSTLKLMAVNQGGSIFVDLSDRNALINITSLWQDHCEVEFDQIGDEKSVQVTENDGIAYIHSSSEIGTSSEIVLNLFVPEMINIYIKANSLDITFKNKVWTSKYMAVFLI